MPLRSLADINDKVATTYHEWEADGDQFDGLDGPQDPQTHDLFVVTEYRYNRISQKQNIVVTIQMYND